MVKKTQAIKDRAESRTRPIAEPGSTLIVIPAPKKKDKKDKKTT